MRFCGDIKGTWNYQNFANLHARDGGAPAHFWGRRGKSARFSTLRQPSNSPGENFRTASFFQCQPRRLPAGGADEIWPTTTLLRALVLAYNRYLLSIFTTPATAPVMEKPAMDIYGLIRAQRCKRSGCHVVHDQVKSKLKLEYEYLGEQQVKNIAKPVRVIRCSQNQGMSQGLFFWPCCSVTRPERWWTTKKLLVAKGPG